MSDSSVSCDPPFARFPTAEAEDPLILSALNDYLYCPRRCALHRLEGVWHDNVHTVQGTQSHAIADDPGYRETAAGAHLERALPLFSHRMNLIGKADIVEFRSTPAPSDRSVGPPLPMPVDYKLGQRHKWDNDDVQLCAQALCLEEMLNVVVPQGAVYHIKTHRRRTVEFTTALRHLTLETIENVRRLFATRQIPPAVLKPQCNGCSLHDTCMPELNPTGDKLTRAYAELYSGD